MSGTGASSPFIKDEPDEWNFAANGIMSANQNYANANNMGMNNFNSGSVNPSELSGQNGDFNDFTFNQQSNMSGSFNMGNSHFRDDELLDLELNDISRNQGQMGHHSTAHDHQDMHDMFANQNQMHNQNPQHMFPTNTPNGDPIQSPFANSQFNYATYQQQQQQLAQQAHMSPHMRPVPGQMQGEFNFAGPRSRHSLPHVMDRKPSDSRSPMTPKTPALGGLNLGGTPDSGSIPSQPIHASSLGHRHHKSLSEQWGSTPGSLQSDMYSPLASPANATSHAAISEVLKSGKHASLPSKVDVNSHVAPAYQTQEAKRRRRRESHNMVERRRRDNINERIQELSHLVPQHRLEDEKVRKHLANNGPISPSLAATNMSPPQATSLLAAGGRRATGAGSITMGIPIEEKDKGPNKGDILNGSVGWTRDLMWALHSKFEREERLKEIIEKLGGTWPYQEAESEKRMRTELMDAMEKNDASTFDYSRGNGSGLRVPKHTSIDGTPLPLDQGANGMSPQDLNEPAAGQNNGQFWESGTRGSISFKEEEEYDMQM